VLTFVEIVNRPTRPTNQNSSEHPSKEEFNLLKPLFIKWVKAKIIIMLRFIFI